MTATMTDLADLRAQQAKERADADRKAQQLREDTIRDLLTGGKAASAKSILSKLDAAGVSLDDFAQRKDQDDHAWRTLQRVDVGLLMAEVEAYDTHRQAWDAAQLEWEIVGRFIDPNAIRRAIVESLDAAGSAVVTDQTKLDRFTAAARAVVDCVMATCHRQTQVRELLKTKLRCELILSRPTRDKADDAGLHRSIELVTDQLAELQAASVGEAEKTLAARVEFEAAKADLPRLAG